MLLSFPWIKAAELLHFGVASSSPQMWLCLRKGQPLLDGGSWVESPGRLPWLPTLPTRYCTVFHGLPVAMDGLRMQCFQFVQTLEECQCRVGAQ